MVIWDDKPNPLWLFTPDELNQLPYGTRLESISGNFVVKGKDYIDDETRFGHIAFGIRNPFQHELKETFIEWRLKSGY